MRCDPNDDAIPVLYSANMTSNSSSFISLFTIKSVSLSLHNTRWFCNAEFNANTGFLESSRFDLHVFSLPELPVCDEIKLLNKSNIQVYCWTNKVFPGSVCLFNVKTN
ncbi:unnamed protein product, partial [Lymnaea stagnalis]